MTENGRFKATYEDGYCVMDGETDLLYHMDNEMITKEMSNLLNRLNDELKKLESINQDHKNYIGDLEEDFTRFQEENEQLKKDRNELFIRERDARNDWRKLKYENEELKKELDKFIQPNCKKCMHYSKDSAGTYCMCENGLLNSAWEMFPFKWDYTNAKNCKEYEE